GQGNIPVRSAPPFHVIRKGPYLEARNILIQANVKESSTLHAFGHGGETRLTGSDGLLPAVHGIDGDALGFLQPFGPEAILQPPAGERRGVGFGKTQTEQVQKISPVFRSQVSEAVAYNLHHRSQGKLPVKTSRNARVDGQVIPPLHQRARQPVGGSRHTDSGNQDVRSIAAFGNFLQIGPYFRLGSRNDQQSHEANIQQF